MIEPIKFFINDKHVFSKFPFFLLFVQVLFILEKSQEIKFLLLVNCNNKVINEFVFHFGGHFQINYNVIDHSLLF